MKNDLILHYDYENPQLLDTQAKVDWANSIELHLGQPDRRQWHLGDHCRYVGSKFGPKRVLEFNSGPVTTGGLIHTCQVCGHVQTMGIEYFSYAPPHSPWRKSWEREIEMANLRYITCEECGSMADRVADS